MALSPVFGLHVLDRNAEDQYEETCIGEDLLSRVRRLLTAGRVLGIFPADFTAAQFVRWAEAKLADDVLTDDDPLIG